MTPQKVLVTGGYGFIGSRLARQLHSKGLEVVVLEHPNAIVSLGLESCQVVRVDVSDDVAMSSMQVGGIDAVLHLAAQSSGPRSFLAPVLDVKLNVLGTVNIINWCLQNNVDRLLFASSFVIYGDHPGREALDEDVRCRPKSVYATSKLASEHLLMNYAQPNGIRWNSLRMFNVYGAGQDITKSDQGIVGIFMNMLLHRDVVQVMGRLDRFRDLICVDDVIQGWEKCLYGDKVNVAYNLGTGEKTTFDQLIRAIARVVGKESQLKIVELEGMPGDIMGCYADLTRVRRDLGYSPQYSLISGLEQMWDWVRGWST